MADGIASDLVTGVLGKLGNALWDEIGLLRSFKDDADDLRSNFSAIQAVLLDAEERSSAGKESHALRDWLRKLKDAAYDADDLLDEIRTEAEKVRGFLSRANPMHLKFKVKMAHRMKELREKIGKIAKQRNDFGLAEAGPVREAEFKRPETFSVVDEKTIVGRDGDKEKIVKLLLEINSDHDVSVIPIVGLGTIAKPVISAAGENCALDNSDAVATCLVRIFSQKRFLLVLDDVWNEDQNKWKELNVVFKDSKKGSKVLVTTRSEKVAEIMKTVEPHRVKGLSYNDCWTLFKRRAFKEGEENDYPSLVAIGKQIVKKCGGVPLAANALGSMMRFKSRTEDAWSAIRDNEIWSLKEEKTILPSLKLSYIQMPSALKQCFVYCSIFPKGYEIGKDDLIRQWIALGFISSHETRTSMEHIGDEYFKDLLWMSFLQDVKQNYRKVTTCRMHDLVHDLAQSVAREEVAVIVGEESTRIPEGCRYASIDSSSMPQIPTTVVRRLRALQFSVLFSRMVTLIIMSPQNLHDLNLSYLKSLVALPECIGSLQNLRILDLSNCFSLESLPSSLCDLKNLHDLNLSCLKSLVALPESIGSLQNLRILNVSECCSLQSLPSSSSDLQHLEKLDISGCGKLCELPKMIQKLTKLRVLLNNNCSELKGMPQGIGKLVSLQELSVFVIGKQDRVEHCASISELEHLKLVGELRIKGLENVTSPVDAKAANLIEKNLRSLKLEWNVLSAEEGMDSTVLPAEEIETVLENLQPHQKLVELNIRGYGGRKFPSWMMNRIGLCLPNLDEIRLDNIPVCSSLPPLGQLPFLTKLQIGDMPAITNLGVDKFPVLMILKLSSMPLLREWVTVLTVDDEEGRRERVPIFPCLGGLLLKECPQLRPEPCLPPSVEYLLISQASKENLSLILECVMPLGGGDAAVSLQPPPDTGLRELIIQKCRQLTCLPESLRGLTSLQWLTIWDCKGLERIEDWLGELTELQSLEISGCSSLRYLPAHKMTTLKKLHIKGSPLLFDADEHFVDTSVDHIEEVKVDGRPYPYEELVSSSSKEESSPKLLRYLDHSGTRIQELPESITSLCNLQKLNLSSDLQHLEKLDISGCGKLCELPKMIQKLTKLRVLLNNNCSELKGMPRGIGKLVSLQELSVFVVGKQDRVEHCATISELGHLKLVGELRIKGLENVTSPVDAKAANLIEKNLRSLKLEWNVLSAEEGMDSVLPAEEMDTVLENLQPHQKLSKLEIEGYGGGKFPSWMMNRIGSCLPNLVEIKLDNIPVCSSLPPLGQLPFLKELITQNMPAITNLGVEKFTALTSLCLFSMPMLREWVTKQGESIVNSRMRDALVGGDAAVSLQPPPDKGLQGLIIGECQQLTCLPQSLRDLTSLQSLYICSCEDLERIEDWLGELSGLQSLVISKCSNLRYLPAHKMTTLKKLSIDDCPLLFDAAEQFVDTNVNHIEEVSVNGRKYPYEEEGCSSPEKEESSPKEEEKKKKSRTNRWSRSNWLARRA
uniref:Disease resistance protein RGA3 n=1 Tax=Ananas comosus var. bracteatus TaxID=296719 RepID=A0A6V7PEE7_ANACO|nr:unnamed protein product [Ananas comosus var. bracteatus]